MIMIIIIVIIIIIRRRMIMMMMMRIALKGAIQDFFVLFCFVFVNSPENLSPNKDSNLHSSLSPKLGKQTS